MANDWFTMNAPEGGAYETDDTRQYDEYGNIVSGDTPVYYNPNAVNEAFQTWTGQNASPEQQQAAQYNPMATIGAAVNAGAAMQNPYALVATGNPYDAQTAGTWGTMSDGSFKPQQQPQAQPGPDSNQPDPNGPKGPPNFTFNPRFPSFTPSPFIMPNGGVPPGLPYAPTPHLVEAQNKLLGTLLNEPIFGPNYINAANEQQKEIALARQQSADRTSMQRAANRGVSYGGNLQAGLRRNANEATRNILQGRRDIDMAATTGNRQGFLDALGVSNSVFGTRDQANQAMANLLESIRRYDQDLLNDQAKFSSQMQFNYDNLNSDAYQQWLDYIGR